MKNRNSIRVVSPNGETLHSGVIRTGIAWGARRVTKTIVRTLTNNPGARVEVLTTKGWEPRVLVPIRGNHYTRVS